jgi:hypothetical protein
VPAEQYAAEDALVGDESHIHAPEDSLNVALLQPVKGSAEDELALLSEERSTRPDEPLWRGVSDMRTDGERVRVEFVPRVEPTLRPVPDSSVQVSCHLYHDPGDR